MSLVKIPDDLEIEIIDEQDLKDAKKLLLELFCIEEIYKDKEIDCSVKDELVHQLIALISIYTGNYTTHYCDSVEHF